MAQEFRSSWPKDVQRIWVGPEYWANRLQDWRISQGRLECIEGRAKKPMRTVHLLTRRMGTKEGEFFMSVRTGVIGRAAKVSADSATGFLVGAGSELDYRAAALVHHSFGPGGGIIAVMEGTGRAVFRDMAGEGYLLLAAAKNTPESVPEEVELCLTGELADGIYKLNLAVLDVETGKVVSEATLENVDSARLVGNVALVSHPGSGKVTGRFWFRDWKVSGSKFEVHNERLCGPVLSTQYTLSRNVLKMTAQMMPVEQADTQIVTLQIQQDGQWKTITTAKIIVPGYTVTFRIDSWDSTKDRPYRVVYELRQADGSTKEYDWSGTIQREPVDKETIILAGFTGNHNMSRNARFLGLDRGRFTWTKDEVWFPHTDIVEHVSRQKPDVLFFSGDQVYEGASPTAAEKSPEDKAELDYMYKWYLWCWAFRDLTRDRVCVTIPDDHDVYQGNLWGADGRKTNKDNRGGYIMPAEFIKMVERTQTSHLPDPYDPTPIEQEIGVYYCGMNYGRISFAILEDRKFKSGCSGIVPQTASGRADHVVNPSFDPRTADVSGAKLLGERQLKFLKDWAADWRGADMKVALSQTVFANVATHHGDKLVYLIADYDSNGWPQRGRNKALYELRRAFAFMIGGDQHLSTVVHHGVENFNDAGWSFCVPSIANFYPRAWLPLKEGGNRKESTPDYTGEFLDGFGNHITVWAATNPTRATGREPAELHDKMPGYGIVKFDKNERTITIECWPRYADPETDGQYPGWPITIKQADNYARKAAAYLPAIKVSGMTGPVVQVIDEAKGEIVYTLRIKGTSFRPKVFKDGTYTVKVGEPETVGMKTLKNVRSISSDNKQTVEVNF
jgi:hypothetical protein